MSNFENDVIELKDILTSSRIDPIAHFTQSSNIIMQTRCYSVAPKMFFKFT